MQDMTLRELISFLRREEAFYKKHSNLPMFLITNGEDSAKDKIFGYDHELDTIYQAYVKGSIHTLEKCLKPLSGSNALYMELIMSDKWRATKKNIYFMCSCRQDVSSCSDPVRKKRPIHYHDFEVLLSKDELPRFMNRIQELRAQNVDVLFYGVLSSTAPELSWHPTPSVFEQVLVGSFLLRGLHTNKSNIDDLREYFLRLIERVTRVSHYTV